MSTLLGPPAPAVTPSAKAFHISTCWAFLGLRSPPMIQIKLVFFSKRWPIHFPYAFAFLALKISGPFPQVDLSTLSPQVGSIAMVRPNLPAIVIRLSTCAKYFSLGFVGSKSMSGKSPLAFGVCNPSNSAKATA